MALLPGYSVADTPQVVAIPPRSGTCSCAGNPQIPASLLAPYIAKLQSIVAGVLADLKALGCAVAKVTLYDAIQAFIDGVGLECPECLPFLVPIGESLYQSALQELDKVCT